MLRFCIISLFCCSALASDAANAPTASSSDIRTLRQVIFEIGEEYKVPTRVIASTYPGMSTYKELFHCMSKDSERTRDAAVATMGEIQEKCRSVFETFKSALIVEMTTRKDALLAADAKVDEMFVSKQHADMPWREVFEQVAVKHGVDHKLLMSHADLKAPINYLNKCLNDRAKRMIGPDTEGMSRADVEKACGPQLWRLEKAYTETISKMKAGPHEQHHEEHPKDQAGGEATEEKRMDGREQRDAARRLITGLLAEITDQLPPPEGRQKQRPAAEKADELGLGGRLRKEAVDRFKRGAIGSLILLVVVILFVATVGCFGCFCCGCCCCLPCRKLKERKQRRTSDVEASNGIKVQFSPSNEH